MSIQVFDPDPKPSPGTDRSPEVSINEVPFGDGYTLASPNGINNVRYTLSLRWTGLDPTQIQTLESFFASHKGTEPFLYTHFGDNVQRKWTCKKWSAGFGAPGKFSATLVENFTL